MRYYDYGAVSSAMPCLNMPATPGRFIYHWPASMTRLSAHLSETFEQAPSLPHRRRSDYLPGKNETDAIWYACKVTPPPSFPADAEKQLIQTALTSEIRPKPFTPRSEIVAHLASLPANPAQFVSPPKHCRHIWLGPAGQRNHPWPLTRPWGAQ
jgi:hypothetical protein